MATKQNMYVGTLKEAQKILEDINNSILVYFAHDDGFHQIAGYDISMAKEIRDEVSNMQGKLQILIKGLDKNSPLKDKYKGILKQCNHFLEVTKQN